MDFLGSMKTLEELGFTLWASLGTADFYSEHGCTVHPIEWPFDSSDHHHQSNQNGAASSNCECCCNMLEWRYNVSCFSQLKTKLEQMYCLRQFEFN